MSIYAVAFDQSKKLSKSGSSNQESHASKKTSNIQIILSDSSEYSSSNDKVSTTIKPKSEISTLTRKTVSNTCKSRNDRSQKAYHKPYQMNRSVKQITQQSVTNPNKSKTAYLENYSESSSETSNPIQNIEATYSLVTINSDDSFSEEIPKTEHKTDANQTNSPPKQTVNNHSNSSNATPPRPANTSHTFCRGISPNSQSKSPNNQQKDSLNNLTIKDETNCDFQNDDLPISENNEDHQNDNSLSDDVILLSKESIMSQANNSLSQPKVEQNFSAKLTKYELRIVSRISFKGKKQYFILFHNNQPLFFGRPKTKGESETYILIYKYIEPPNKKEKITKIYKKIKPLSVVLTSSNCTFFSLRIRENDPINEVESDIPIPLSIQFSKEVETIKYSRSPVDCAPREIEIYFFNQQDGVPSMLVNRKPKIGAGSTWILDIGNRVAKRSIKNCVIVDVDNKEYMSVMKQKSSIIAVESSSLIGPIETFTLGISSVLCNL